MGFHIGATFKALVITRARDTYRANKGTMKRALPCTPMPTEPIVKKKNHTPLYFSLHFTERINILRLIKYVAKVKYQNWDV